MYCENCGKEIEDNVSSCPECGMEIEEVQSKSPKENFRRRGRKKVVILFILFACFLTGSSVLFKVVKAQKYKNSMAMGKQYLKEHRYEEAISSFEEAIKYSDMEIEPYWNKAKTYTEMRDADQAGQVYDQVIDVLINKAAHEEEIPKDTEEICKEVMAFWGNLDTMEKEEKLVEIESMLSKINPYIDDSIREELYFEKVIYEHNGMASDHLKGTYVSATKKSYGQASVSETQYVMGEFCKTGVVFYEKGDFDSDGKKEMVMVYSYIHEDGTLGLTASFYSYDQNRIQDYDYSLADIKSANFHFFVNNNYFVMVIQEDESNGFYEAVYYPVLNKMEEYQKSTDNHFNEKICVINLGEEFKTVCEFKRVIDDSSSDNHTSTSTLHIDEGKNKNGFSKGYTSYGWPSDTEVILDEEEMNRKVLSILFSYKIDNINLHNITWDDRKTALAVETNSSMDNITRIVFTSSEGTLDESDEYNVKVTGTFTMDIVNTR